MKYEDCTKCQKSFCKSCIAIHGCSLGPDPSSKYDPFAEDLNDHIDEHFDAVHFDDHFPEDYLNNVEQKTANFASYAKKQAAARAKLKGVKKIADAKWQEHIRSSTRIRQLSTHPDTREGSSNPGEPERFEVHESHRLMAVRSVVFCKTCGYWATKKSQKLKAECSLKPLHSDGSHKLRRMLRGLHPEAKLRTWPEGHDARVPHDPVPLHWNSQHG